MHIAHMQPIVKLHIMHVNKNTLFNKRFNQQKQNHFHVLVAWMQSMHNECDLDADGSIQRNKWRFLQVHMYMYSIAVDFRQILLVSNSVGILCIWRELLKLEYMTTHKTNTYM